MYNEYVIWLCNHFYSESDLTSGSRTFHSSRIFQSLTHCSMDSLKGHLSRSFRREMPSFWRISAVETSAFSWVWWDGMACAAHSVKKGENPGAPNIRQKEASSTRGRHTCDANIKVVLHDWLDGRSKKSTRWTKGTQGLTCIHTISILIFYSGYREYCDIATALPVGRQHIYCIFYVEVNCSFELTVHNFCH